MLHIVFQFNFLLIVLSQKDSSEYFVPLSEFTRTHHKKCSQLQKNIHHCNDINTQSSWHYKLFKNSSWFWAFTLFTTWLAKFENVAKVSMKAGVFCHNALGLIPKCKHQSHTEHCILEKSKSKLYLNHALFKNPPKT